MDSHGIISCMRMQCECKYVEQRVCIRVPDCRFIAVQVFVWTVMGMFLNPNRVGPFFAAATGFTYHIVCFYRGLENQLKEAKMKLKQMMQEFRANLPEGLMQLATKITDQIEKEANKICEHGIAGENGSSSWPEFATELMEDYANQKIRSSKIPAEVKRRLLGLVNKKLEAHGVMDEVEFVMQISPFVSAGDHQGVSRVLKAKILDIFWTYLESRGFPALLRALMKDASATVEDVSSASTMQDLRNKAKDMVEGLIKDELAPRTLAGPECMHPMLSSKLTGILTRMIDNCGKNTEKGVEALRMCYNFNKDLEKMKNKTKRRQASVRGELVEDERTGQKVWMCGLYVQDM